MAEEIIIKILILGDSNVGKTSLLLKYTDNFFPDSHVATIGIDYKVKPYNINGLEIKMQLWDTSGQERFRSVTHNFLKNAHGIAYVYDITNKKSFEGVKDWLKDAENNGSGEEKKILIGNKIDLDRKREVSQETLEKFGNKKKIPTFEVSAKADINVNEAFDYLAKLITKDKTKEQIIAEFGEKENKINICTKKSNSKETKKRQCCSK